MENRYTVFSLKLARKLIEDGFNYMGSGIDAKNPKYNVYFFEKSAELIAAIEEYKAATNH